MADAAENIYTDLEAQGGGTGLGVSRVPNEYPESDLIPSGGTTRRVIDVGDEQVGLPRCCRHGEAFAVDVIALVRFGHLAEGIGGGSREVVLCNVQRDLPLVSVLLSWGERRNRGFRRIALSTDPEAPLPVFHTHRSSRIGILPRSRPEFKPGKAGAEAAQLE